MPTTTQTRHGGRAAAPLPISEQCIEECLLAQPNTQLAASAFAALFMPQSEDEQLQLTKCISRVAELVTDAKGEAVVQLRSKSLLGGKSSRLGGGGGGPLPIEPLAVRALLLAQPQAEMAASELRARFAPADEAQRLLLVELIGQHSELVVGANGEPALRLVPSEYQAGTPAGAGGGGSASAVARAVAQPAHEPPAPITDAERDLVRQVLCARPGFRMRADELVKLLAPPNPTAKRRLARVVAEVATAVETPDGCGGSAAYLVLRDENSPSNILPPHQHAAAASLDAASAASTGGDRGDRVRAGGAGGRHASRHCPSSLTDASRASTRPASMISAGSSASAYWAASASAVSSASAAAEAASAEPTLPVTEEALYSLLRGSGGRMGSAALIAKFLPLDAPGKRQLAALVQQLCKTLLPETDGPSLADAAGSPSGAVVVLREALIRERTEARAAAAIQRTQRARQAALDASVAAAIEVQAGVRRWFAFREACYRWEARRSATLIQAHARRLGYMRQLRHARAELRAAATLQMATRRVLLSRRVGAREWAKHEAAVAVQAARRRQLAARECGARRRQVRMALETPAEREAREAQERTCLLRDKLRRRKRIEQRQQDHHHQQQHRVEAPPPRQAHLEPPQAPPLEPPPVAEQVQGRSWHHAATAETAATAAGCAREEHPPQADDGEDDAEVEGIGAMLSRLASEAHGGSGTQLLGAAMSGEEQELHDAVGGGDFMAAMRQMIAAHGGASDSDDDMA
jgi:hypothetical protein